MDKYIQFLYLETDLNTQILDWLELYLACFLKILLDPCLTLFHICIGVVLGLALGNSFDTLIGFLLCNSFGLELGTLIGTIMRPLLINYMVRSLEVFLGLPLYIFFNSPLRDLFDSDSWYNFLQLIVYIPLGSKVRYSDLVGSSSWDTLVVPPSGSGLRFHLLPSGACPDFPSQANLAMTFSGFSPTLPRWLRRS